MRIKLIIIIIIFCCSCGRKSSTEPEYVDNVLLIDLLSKPESIVKKLSEFTANIEYIQLQTTENCLIGNSIRKVIYVDNRVYLLNIDEILCFEDKGKFLFKLQNTGRGPEEYVNIADFDVSSDNKNLIILSQKKMLIYGISDTGFIFHRSVTLKDPAPYRVSLVPETDKAILAIPPWRGTEPTLSLLISTVGDTIHFKPNYYKYKMVRKTNSWAINEMLVYSIGNVVCFKEEFSDTVFYVDAKDNSFKPRAIFNSHGTLSTAEMRGSPGKPANNTTFVANIFETSRYVFYWYDTWQERPVSNLILFDKTTKTKYNLDFDNGIKCKLKDDLTGGPDFNIEFLNYYCSGGKLFSFVEAVTLKKYVAGTDFVNAQAVDLKKKNGLRKLAVSIEETDNPVLVIATPKE